MTHNDSQATAVPLMEQLRSVPADARLRIDTPNALGCMDTRSIPVGRLCHDAAAALSALAAGKVEAWRPIETAPKDGTHILAYWPQHPYGEDDNLDESKVVGGTQVVTFYSGGGWCEPDYLEAVGSYYLDDYAYAAEPTHWMPLPASPSPLSADPESAVVGAATDSDNQQEQQR